MLLTYGGGRQHITGKNAPGEDIEDELVAPLDVQRVRLDKKRTVCGAKRRKVDVSAKKDRKAY